MKTIFLYALALFTAKTIYSMEAKATAQVGDKRITAEIVETEKGGVKVCTNTLTVRSESGAYSKTRVVETAKGLGGNERSRTDLIHISNRERTGPGAEKSETFTYYPASELVRAKTTAVDASGKKHTEIGNNIEFSNEGVTVNKQVHEAAQDAEGRFNNAMNHGGTISEAIESSDNSASKGIFSSFSSWF